MCIMNWDVAETEKPALWLRDQVSCAFNASCSTHRERFQTNNRVKGWSDSYHKHANIENSHDKDFGRLVGAHRSSSGSQQT